MKGLAAASSHDTPRGPGGIQLRHFQRLECMSPGPPWEKLARYQVQLPSCPREDSTAFGYVADLKNKNELIDK